MKKSLALMLALIMALCMIPTTAFAADIIDQKNSVSIYKGEPTYSYFLRNFPGGSITKQKNEEVTWQRLPRYTNICNCGRVLEEVIPDLYCINPDKNIKITNPKVIGECGVRVASWKGNDVYNGYPCFEFYCKAAKAGETDVTVTYYYNYNYRGASGYCNNCGRRVTVPAQTTWYEEFVTFHVKVVGEDPVGIPDKPTDISGIVGESAVKVHCTNDKSSHADETFALIAGSFTIGDVTKDTTSGNYTCTITVQSEKYVNDYSASIKVNHELDGSSTGTIKLKWNETDKKWVVDSTLPVVFDVKCETTQPPTDKPEPPTPPNTSKPFIELTGEEAVKVHCTNDKANHADKSYGLMHDGYTVGDVEGNATSGYTCDITVKPEKYVEAYNSDPDINVEHKLDPESQTGTIHLKYDKEAQKWQLANPSGVPVVFNVKCDNTQPPLDKTIPIEVSKVWEDDNAAGVQSITVGLYANGIKVKNATIRPDSEGTWFHRFDNMPANDSNGNPINYTVKEENIPDGYTPHYYTSGEHDKRLVFRVKNVPTDKTGAIKVSKELSGEGAEKDKEFAFTVTLLEYLDSNEVLDGGEPGYYPLSGIYTFGGFEFRDGKVTFGLKGGESVTISGIPAEYDYTVTESNNAGYTVTSENDKGTIRAKGTAEVKFTNTKSAAPTVSPTPTPTPGGGNGGGGHWHPTTTPVPVIVIPPKTGDMTIWQSILHFLGIR